MIILIRHAQSEGNKNRDLHQTVPDHRVKLTPEGHRQAHEAGSKLREVLRPDDTLHFFTSPYRRTRETTEGLINSLTSDSPSPSPFPRHTIQVYEEPRLREQDFGNFQPCSAEMERMWLERADYGHFFYRIPNGESAADAYDRVSGFNESLWRLFGEDDFASVCVLVTHGLMTRVFLMKWYHWSVEYFEDLRNINHCEFVIMKLNPDNGKYTLQNNMRTWSELKKERELERQRKGLAPAPAPPDGAMSIRRRWGGCPDGCNHGIRRKTSLRTTRANGADARHDHDTHKKMSGTGNTQDSNQGNQTATRVDQLKTENAPPARPEARRLTTTTPDDHDHYISLENLAPPPAQTSPEPENNGDSKESTSHVNPKPSLPNASPATNTAPKRPPISNPRKHSEDYIHAPPMNLALLRLVGRDGGGSMSGTDSLAPSEDEREESAPASPAAVSHANKPIPRPVVSHQPRPSQDLGNDGDDEGNGNKEAAPQRLKRGRSYHHHHHHHHHYHHNGKHVNPPVVTGNTLGDQDRDTDETDHHLLVDRETSTLLDQNQEPQQQQQQQETEKEEHNQDDAHENYDDTQDGIDVDDSALDAERQKDQSLRGSVY